MNSRDLNYWTEMIFRRRNTVLQVCAVVFGLVVIGTLILPPSYQGTAKIFVRDNRAELLVSPGMQAESPQNPRWFRIRSMKKTSTQKWSC